MPSRSARSDQAPVSDPFDLWLRRSLHANWDGALNERVPDDLLRLCSDDRLKWAAIKARWLRTETSGEA